MIHRKYEKLLSEIKDLFDQYHDKDYLKIHADSMVSNAEFKHSYLSGILVVNRQIEKMIEKNTENSWLLVGVDV